MPNSRMSKTYAPVNETSPSCTVMCISCLKVLVLPWNEMSPVTS